MYDWRVMRFIWDDENVAHIARHDVVPEEAEDVVTWAGSVTFPGRKGRSIAVGRTAARRPLRVVYDVIGRAVRVTTAHQIREQVYTRMRKEAQP
jgi:uncharacterized DUF497 family protein